MHGHKSNFYLFWPHSKNCGLRLVWFVIEVNDLDSWPRSRPRSVKMIKDRTGDQGQNFGLEARIEAECVISMSRTRAMPNFWPRGRSRGQKYQAEAEVNVTRLGPTLRPKCWPRGQTFGHKAKVEAKVLTLRPITRPRS